MIFSDLKLYLKTNLAAPSLDFIWSQEDNKQFFAYIKKSFPDQNVLDDDGIVEIKQAFKEYFEDVGNVIFYLEGRHILLKVISYETNPEESINLDAIFEIIDDNEGLIEFDYKGNENQILIQQELRKKIFDFVDNIRNEEINKKELIKYAIREALELQDSDIIVVKFDSIFIKLLSNLKRKQITNEEKYTKANRYNGIDEDELRSFYEEYFLNDNKNFFSLVAKLFVDKYFIEDRIDNSEYEKNVFPYIQLIIIQQLVQTFDHNEDFFKGFAGYIFRIHFQEVFMNISDLILNELYISNSYMNEFLKYYSLDVVVINGLKYRIPPLKADNGQLWNLISISSIAKVYIKVKASIEKLGDDVIALGEKISAMYIGGMSPIEYNDQLSHKNNTAVSEIANSKKELIVYSDKADATKDADEKKRLKKKVSTIKSRLTKLQAEKESIESKIIDSTVIKRYTDLDVELQKIKRQIKAEEKILLQNKHTYISVKKTITKALISKKKRI